MCVCVCKYIYMYKEAVVDVGAVLQPSSPIGALVHEALSY